MKIIENYPYKYVWEENIYGYGGCEVCRLKDKNICPPDCNKIGYYRFMSFDEMKSEYRRQVAEEWKKHKK